MTQTAERNPPAEIANAEELKREWRKAKLAGDTERLKQIEECQAQRRKAHAEEIKAAQQKRKARDAAELETWKQYEANPLLMGEYLKKRNAQCRETNAEKARRQAEFERDREQAAKEQVKIEAEAAQADAEKAKTAAERAQTDLEARDQAPPPFEETRLAKKEFCTPENFAQFFSKAENTITSRCKKLWPKHKGKWRLRHKESKELYEDIQSYGQKISRHQRAQK